MSNDYKDNNIWNNISSGVSLSDLIELFKSPCPFQKELSIFIQKKYEDKNTPSSIEVGSSFGVTSALLPIKFKKTILDLDLEALKKAKRLYEIIGQNVEVIHMDMFNLNQLEVTFDLVFNAGVLEHFTAEERKKIIINMAKVVKKDGYIVIAIPNHKSLPYRVSYLYRVLVNKWLYPKEYKICSLASEIEDFKEIVLVEELSLDKESIYYYLPKPFKKIFKLLNRMFDFDGYLKVFVFKKGKYLIN